MQSVSEEGVLGVSFSGEAGRGGEAGGGLSLKVLGEAGRGGEVGVGLSPL